MLGPDYFMGTSVQDVPKDYDKFVWAQDARAAANKAFPAWLEAVKAKYGKRSPRKALPCL